MHLKSLFLIFLKIVLCLSTCIIDKNHCLRCNPVTKLCVKCDKEIFTPDKNGGCQYSYKCELGINYCLDCDQNGKICNKCREGYFPDENGGCSYTDYCEISYRGECLKCKDNFILIGRPNIYSEGEIKICKSLNSDDLKNCEIINNYTGICEECKEGFYLNKGDKNCVSIENCYQSVLGVCTKCNKNYYLDKKDSKCKNQTSIFEFCKMSLDGKTCDICDEDYYFDEKGKCSKVNFCKESINEYNCKECESGYYLNKYATSCVSTENCLSGESNLGICSFCIDGYYMDYKDGKCKTNIEDNDFKYCQIADDDKCMQCTRYYELGADNKCSNTKNCAETKNGECISCIDKYYIGLDNQCTDIEHCIYSSNYECLECEDKYYYDKSTKKCMIGNDNFNNCKSGNSSSVCEICKNDFYLNQINNLCYSNKENGKFYKCSKSDLKGEYCTECVEGYFLGEKDKKCSKIEGCILSENENKCLECQLYFCLDSKTGQCVYNDIIDEEEKKFYFRCNKTNEEGNACEICEEGYILDENGLCREEGHCIEKNEDGSCKRCQNDLEGIFCLNKDFGCVEIYYNNNCLECNNNLEFINCSKCLDGYILDENNDCYESDDE